jgi:hypothetical protein
MKVHLITTKATSKQIDEMLETLNDYIKVAVDIQKGILAGGGGLHADCEAVLIENGSQQEDIWGADWIPISQELRYEALLNIQPRRKNPSMQILDPEIRTKVAEIVRRLLADETTS